MMLPQYRSILTKLVSLRNMEVIWLLKKLRPDFKTIADFHKDNKKALKAVFRYSAITAWIGGPLRCRAPVLGNNHNRMYTKKSEYSY